MPNREYDNTSRRWISPDPAGLAAADPMKPRSWNRYAYVRNNPLSFLDPLGLQCVTLDDGTVGDDGAPPACGQVSGAGDTTTVNGGAPPDIPTVDIPTVCNHAGYGCPYGSNPVGLNPYNNSGGAPSSGGRGTAGSSGLPTRWQFTKRVNQCAASYADAHSLANVLGVAQVPVLGSALSNDAATASNLIFGPNRAGAAKGLALSNPTSKNAIAAGARLVGALPNPFAAPNADVTVTAASVSTDAFEVTSISVDVSRTLPTIGESALGNVAGGLLNALTAFKAPYDAALYINGLAGCAGFPHF